MTDQITHTITAPFTGTARGARENRAAHGNVCEVQVRADGARRQINRNGSHTERGRWYRYTGEVSASGRMSWEFTS